MKRRDFLIGAGLLGLAGQTLGMPVFKPEMLKDGVILKYRVFYGDSQIGHQEVSINKHSEPGHIIIKHNIDLEVKILFAVAYALQHESTEIWSTDKVLTYINSKTVENGEESLVEGKQNSGVFAFNGMDGLEEAPVDVVTSDSFWVSTAMNASSIVNTRTGDVAKPNIKKLDDNRFHLTADFAHGSVDATLHFEGGFLKDAEIDSDGHIVKFQRIAS